MTKIQIIHLYFTCSIKRNEFSIEESVFWVVGGIVVLFLSIFYKSLDRLSSFLGIAYGSSFVFFIAIIFLLLMNFRNSKKILKMNEKINKLSHKVSILEYELKERTKENVKEEKETNRKK